MCDNAIGKLSVSADITASKWLWLILEVFRYVVWGEGGLAKVTRCRCGKLGGRYCYFPNPSLNASWQAHNLIVRCSRMETSRFRWLLIQGSIKIFKALNMHRPRGHSWLASRDVLHRHNPICQRDANCLSRHLRKWCEYPLWSTSANLRMI